MSKPSEIAAQLKVVWEAEIQLFDRIQRFDFMPQDGEPVTNEDREILSEMLAELTRKGSTSKRLQTAWNQLGLTFEKDLAALRTKRDDTLDQAMEFVLRTQKSANTSKYEVLKQLAEVNQAQAGYDRYSQR